MWLYILSFVTLITCVLGDEDTFHSDKGFDASAYGVYPIRKYMTTDIVSPRPNILLSSPECVNNLYTFLTPRGGATSEPQATILDQNGHLIWTTGGYGQIYNLLVQEYKGNKYLTFWAGNDAVGGHGIDQHYNEVLRIGAAGGLDGDLHEFRITEDGTALITVYEIVQKDLTELGKSFTGPVWDCLIQEIVIGTGELVFQWRALDHYTLLDTYRAIGGDGEGGRAFDFFHMNSIAKDLKGNYITSSRYMHSITYINGTTGDVIWILGGKRNNFKDISGGQATNFAYQHDARWADNYTAITMFDNGVDDSHPIIAPTRGLRIHLDQKEMEASLVHEYINPHHIHGISQGSFQTLPSGNVLMGYGNTAAFTEYKYDGTPICDTHYGAENRFGAGEVQSYRVYKFEWHGFPLTDPNVAIIEKEENEWTFFVSWNGATQVKTWVLQGSDTNAHWQDLERREKTEFETGFQIQTLYPRYLRVVAMDSGDNMLGIGGSLDIKEEQTWSVSPLRTEESDTWWLKVLIVFCGAPGLVIGIREAMLLFRSRRRVGFGMTETDIALA